jgi:hypothetical protein
MLHYTDSFVIGGTYELEEDCQDERKNKRTGSLFVFDPKSKSILCEHECDDGGVFDIRIKERSHEGDDDVIVAAHANGRIGIYHISKDGMEMAQRNSFITGCDLLSCITLFDEVVVGGCENCLETTVHKLTT